MGNKKILVDSSLRELENHGTDGFPVTVHHDDLWMFEGKRVPVHWHSEFEIGIPTQGIAVYQIYQKRCEIRPGQAILINSNVPHSCSSADETRVLYHTIIVRPDFLYGQISSDIEKNCFRPFQQNRAVPCLIFDRTKEWGQRVFSLLEQADELFCQRPLCFELRIRGLLCEAFSYLLAEQIGSGNIPQLRQPAETTADLQRLEEMMNYLHTHFDCVISLQELAGQVHLSREVCCRFFRKMTGKTMTEYLTEYRVAQSLPLVQSRQYSMAQIAEMTGFSNASRFAKAFRAYTGYSPAGYRA